MGVITVGWFLCALIGAWVGSGKNETFGGFMLGLLLGPLGLLIAIISPGDRRACPHCAEKVLRAAKVCPHCQREIAVG